MFWLFIFSLLWSIDFTFICAFRCTKNQKKNWNQECTLAFNVFTFILFYFLLKVVQCFNNPGTKQNIYYYYRIFNFHTRTQTQRKKAYLYFCTWCIFLTTIRPTKFAEICRKIVSKCLLNGLKLIHRRFLSRRNKWFDRNLNIYAKIRDDPATFWTVQKLIGVWKVEVRFNRIKKSNKIQFLFCLHAFVCVCEFFASGLVIIWPAILPSRN